MIVSQLFEGRTAGPPSAKIPLLARIFLGAIFVYAGIEKIIHPALFAEALHRYQVLPASLINLTALVLPFLELILGALLLSGVWLPGAVFLSGFLLMVFCSVLVFNLARGLNVSCGCFSTEPSTDPISIWTVLRDAAFLIPAVYLLFARQTVK